MEDSLTGLGRRIVEATRLAVLLHMDAALAGLEGEPALSAYRRRLAGAESARFEEPACEVSGGMR